MRDCRPASCSNDSSRTNMTTDENKQLLQHAFAELANGNGRPFVDSFADDVRWTIVGTTKWSRTYEGKQRVLDELLRPLRERMAGPVKIAAHRFLADEDCVVVEARGEATTKTGRAYNNTYCWIFRLDGGKVREITDRDGYSLSLESMTDAPEESEWSEASAT